MKEQEFNRLVDTLRDSTVTPCPASLERNVLRRIRVSGSREYSLSDWLAGWLGRPVFVAATLAVVVLSSFLTTSLLSQSGISDDPAAELGFDVFANPIFLPTDH